LLDRKRRSNLWKIFSDYRARMVDEGLAEPDDAYREAIEILKAEAPNLPYSSVVVDEAQDMGEQAFRLIRAIVPEKADGDRNSILIVGDAHQRIYGRRATMTACGINVRGRSRRLRLNYRTSDEIRKWAVSILEGVSVDDLDDGTDSLKGYTSVFRGPAPELAGFSSEGKEVDALGCSSRRCPVRARSSLPRGPGFALDQRRRSGRQFRRCGPRSIRAPLVPAGTPQSGPGLPRRRSQSESRCAASARVAAPAPRATQPLRRAGLQSPAASCRTWGPSHGGAAHETCVSRLQVFGCSARPANRMSHASRSAGDRGGGDGEAGEGGVVEREWHASLIAQTPRSK
jgi:hypothetical protein